MPWQCFAIASVKWQRGFVLNHLLMVTSSQTTSWFVACGSLTLVDYDGMSVPAMKGQKSPTIRTKDFSHPLRTVDDFNETIDDFALASSLCH